MSIRASIRNELRLRNLTIWGQWFSVAAAFLLCFAITIGLCFYIVILWHTIHSISMWHFSITMDIGPMNLLYPIAPLALELPQYVQSKYLLLISTGSWFIVPLRQVLKKPLFFELYVPLSVASLYLIRRLKRPGLPDLGTKLGVNLLYFAALLYPANSSGLIYWLSAPYITMGPAVPLICMRLSFVVAGFMFGIAAVLYGIAIARRHPLVSSSLLGGTGVEAMVLTLPSSGPSHQSVGDEAGDGAIRL